MPRKKTVEFIDQSINLSDEIVVSVRWPKGQKPIIKWDGGVVTIALSNARDLLVTGDAKPETHLDTPELLEQKRRLQERHPEMAPKKPFTSEDAFREAGLDPEGLSPEALEAAAAAGGMVV